MLNLVVHKVKRLKAVYSRTEVVSLILSVSIGRYVLDKDVAPSSEQSVGSSWTALKKEVDVLPKDGNYLPMHAASYPYTVYPHKHCC
jgi:hypothetical protein